MKQLAQSIMVSLVFFTVFIAHFNSGVITSFDSRWSIYTAMSILKEGNTNLDEYEKILKEHDYYAIESIDGHLYTIFPVGASLIALPFVSVVEKVSARLLSFDLNEFIQDHIPGGIELLVASFLVALTAVFIYLIACLFLDRRYSLLATLIFAFCTSAWSTASRALWQHGPSMLMLTIALYVILLAKKNPRLIQFASLPLAFSFVVRPTNSLSIALLTLYVLLEYRQFFLRYLLWSSIVALPFLLFNFSVYHSFLSPYYMPQRIASTPHFLEALLGNLISPARGLFIFTPIFVFSIVGLVTKIRDEQFDKLDGFLCGIISLHWISISGFLKWWGGHSFGPRFFSDMIPYLIYFLIPAVPVIFSLKGARKFVITAVFFSLLVTSFLMHYRGATSWDVYGWNVDPVNVDLKPERVWDWGDIQFLRGIRILRGYGIDHNNLGKVLADQGKIDEAIGQFREALRISPGFAEAHYNLANALTFQGRLDEAIDHYLEVIQIRPDHVESHYNLANVLDMQGKLNLAIDAYLEAISLEPDHFKAHNNLAAAYAKLELWDEAIRHYKEAIRIDPDYAGARYNLAMVYLSTKDFDSAWRHARILQRLEDPGARTLISRLRELSKEPKK